MKRLFIFLTIMAFSTIALAQTTTLKFTGVDQNNQHVQLDRVVVTNHSRNWQDTLYWPDTTLVLNTVTGIQEMETFHDTFLQLSQNTPNPFTGTTYTNLTVAEDGGIIVEIVDILGRVVEMRNFVSLQPGIHQLRITLFGVGVYFLSARQNGQMSSVKMVCNGGGDINRIEYVGVLETFDHKSMQSSQQKNGPKYISTHTFQLGDWMEYEGYATINGMEVQSSHVTQFQSISQTIPLQFAVSLVGIDGQPCPGVATVTDIDGNIYNTVQIGNQCWMKENLRTTRYADGNTILMGSITSPSTSTAEAYRYNPPIEAADLSTSGYLYNWPAVMYGANSSTANPSGVQGICPTGWHVPSRTEWTQLLNYVGNQPQYHGENSLASTTGWVVSSETYAIGNDPGSNNATGFSAFPVGCFGSWNSYEHFDYSGVGNSAFFWSSVGSSGQIATLFSMYNDFSYINNTPKYNAYSVRCVLGEPSLHVPTVITASINDIGDTYAVVGGNVTSDGGASVTARGLCWSTTQNPSYSNYNPNPYLNGHTTDGSGLGNFSSDISTLSPGTAYYVCAYATNSVGRGYGRRMSFTTANGYGQPCLGTATVTDIDGNIYNTVQIGNQCWMKENLRTTRYADGTVVPIGTSTLLSTITPYLYSPDNDDNNVPNYGYLYNWPAVMRGSSSSVANPSGVQGICPDGWHLPSDAEWTQLTNYVGNYNSYQCSYNAEYIAKSLASTTRWNTSSNSCTVGNNPDANNTTGFSATPAGLFFGGYYNNLGNYAIYWSSTGNNEDFAYYRSLYYNHADVRGADIYKSYAFSVRCLRD